MDKPAANNPKAIQKAQWESEMFRLLGENMTDYAIFIIDSERRVLSWSRGAEVVLGYTEAEVLGQTVDCIFMPEDIDRKQPEQEVRQALETGRAQDDRWHVRKDGSRFWASGIVTPLWDDQKNLRGFAKIMRDLTESKQREQALQRDEELHRTTAELTSDYGVSCRLEPDGTLVIDFVTDGFRRVTGYTLEEMNAQGGWQTVVPPEDVPIFEQSIRRWLAGEAHTSQLRVCTRSGDIRWVQYYGRTLPPDAEEGITRLYIAAQDITEQRQVDEQLQQQREWLRVTLSSIGDGVVTADTEGRITFLNLVAESLTGWNHEEARGRSFEEIIQLLQEPTHQPVESPIRKALREGQASAMQNQVVLIAQDGTVRPIEASTAPIKDAQGNTIGAVLIFREITEEARARRALQASEARKAAIVETALDCIITIDHEGRIIEFNPAAERTFGYSRADVLGKVMAELIIPPRLRKTHYRAFAHCVATGEGAILNKRVELAAIRADGTEFPVELTIIRLASEGPPIFTGYLRDISERRKTERIRNTRMAVTEILAESGTIDEAALLILKVICENLNWDMGVFWFLDRNANVLRCLDVWRNPSLPAGAFEQMTRQFTFERGVGLPGRVWSRKTPDWISDVGADLNFPRAASAVQEGFYSAFASPLLLGKELLGVVEFFSRSPQHPDSDVQEMMATLGGQIGQFIERRRAEQAQRESEERLRLALTAARLGTWHLDLGTGEFSCSPNCKTNFGLVSESEFTYDQFLELIHPTNQSCIQRTLEQAIEQQTEYNAECEVSWPDGSRHWLAIYGRAMHYVDGRPTSVNGVIMDITERKQAEMRDRLLAEVSAIFVGSLDYELVMRQVAELSVPVLADFCFFDMVVDDRIERVSWKNANPERERLMPQILQFVPSLSDRNHPVPRAIHTGESVFAPVVTAEWLQEISLSREHYEFLRQVHMSSLITVPMKIGEQRLGALTFCYVESGRHYTRVELELAEEIARRAALTVHNARLYEQLQDANRRINEFLAMLAHELRNPLAPIRSGLDLLTMEQRGSEVIDVMKRQVEHLVRLVDDLLDVSRIVRGRAELRKESVELSSVVDRAVESVRDMIDSQQQSLTISLPDEPIWLNADPVRLAQIFSNLLNNSSKYTPAEGRIWLTAQKKASEAVVSVRDTGIGIEPELLSQIFELFTQSERTIDRSQGGLGIGLTIVKYLVERHGGRIAAFSAGAGTGSEFVVWLPLPETPEPLVEMVQPPSVVSNYKILVVDDNLGAARMLQLLLSKLDGHQVEVAYDGLEAIEVAGNYRPDIILLDIGLPKLDGYEVARRLKQQAQFQNTLLVALTGYGTEEDRRKSREAGFDEHLVKPPSVEAIRALFEHPKLNRR